MSIVSLLFWATICTLAVAAPIAVSKGSTVCTSAGWDDYMVFFLTNYLTHAATVVRFPGETSKELNIRRGDALLAPYIGLMYALRKIQWCLVLERNPLRRACRGGALVQVVRDKNWKPLPGTSVKAFVQNEGLRSDNTALQPCQLKKHCRLKVKQTEQSGPKPIFITDLKKRKLVQGLNHFPHGYSLISCQGIPALQLNEPEGAKQTVYYDYRIMESILAICQILFSVVTLYKSEGFQFKSFGYAYFSITVLPFASMSFANLIANCLSVDYPTFHLVDSPELHEAKQRGAMYTAVVGQLHPDPEHERFMVSVHFSETNGRLRACIQSTAPGGDEDLGEVQYEDEPLPQTGIVAHVTVPSNIRALEEAPMPISKGKFQEAWRFFRTQDNIGGILCVPIGVLFFVAPSIVTKLLTGFHSRAPMLQQIGILSWIYFQHFALLFLLFWNIAFGVEHSLQAPSKYATPLSWVLGYSLRTTGLIGYICVILQIRESGICVQV